MTLAACLTETGDDLGQPCLLLRDDGSEAMPRAGHDLVFNGSGECAQFVCASFEGRAASCSRPCQQAGEDCGGGWQCRPAVLDPVSLEILRAATEGRDDDANGEDDRQQLTQGVNESLYCAPP